MSQVHRILNCRGTRIHAVADSPPDQQGPLVVLLHGFPESWYSWRHQIPALAGAGYRVVAIDQRGYGRSSKYRVQKAYRIKELVGDVVGVLDSYGAEQAFVVGHDWGRRSPGPSPGCTPTDAPAWWESAFRLPVAA